MLAGCTQTDLKEAKIPPTVKSGEGKSGAFKLPQTEAVLKGKIAKSYQDSLLVVGEAAFDLYMVSSLLEIYDENNMLVDTSYLKEGQEIEIGFSGVVMESYPAQLGGSLYIKISDQGDDLIGFYEEVFKDLWERDEGLNSDMNVLAFDLSQVTNLTEGEKGALVYIVSSAYGLAGIRGTFDELCEQGYIDKEKLYFEKGLHFILEVTDQTEESFTFNVTKWRGGLGAYFFQGCKAVKTEDGWSYTVGAEMIS